MKAINPFTEYNLCDVFNKFLYLDSGKLFVSNVFSPDDLGFFKKYIGDCYNKIIYYEHEHPVCPDCNVSMNHNGSRSFKPNKLENMYKQQYICPVCGKTHCTNLENFIHKGCNYTLSICEKSLEYASIGYLSYQKKAELIELENGIHLNRATVYYHESKYFDNFINEKEETLKKYLNENNIEPNGIYHYDEEYLHVNGEKMVRLTVIDAVNNLIINDQVISQDDFDKDFIEIFLRYTLEGLAKKVLITDGHSAYPSIIERICINHQLCIFHIIKNHNTDSYKKINRLERRNETLIMKIDVNNLQINELNEYNKGQIGRPSKNDKTKQKRIDTRKDLEKDNKKFKNELKQNKEKLKKLESTNERISNIYDTDTEKASKRRFRTIYNQLDEFDNDTQKFLKNLSKKFNKTIHYFKNEQIPKTNNKIEGYFKITLPRHMKRIFRTEEGLIKWIKLQKLRWLERNLICIKTENSMKNQTEELKI